MSNPPIPRQGISQVTGAFRLAAGLGIALALFMLAAPSAEAQTYATWTHSRTFFFNTTATGANVSGNTANFPVRIRLDASNFPFNQALTNGEDIRFEDPNGASLNYQIEAWNQAQQTAEIWVRVPQVDGNSTQDYIRMFWGKAGATDESNGSNVFRPADGFAGAWHLGENGNNAASGYPDATGNANHGTGQAMTGNSDTTGLAGRAQNFLAASNQGIGFGSGASLHPSGSALTVDAWILLETTGADRVIVSRSYSTNSSPWHAYALALDGSGTKISFTVTTGGTAATAVGAATLGTGTWYHVAGTYDGSNVRVYLDGAQDGSAAKTGSVNNYSMPLLVGKYHHDNSMNFNGRIEEVRVLTATRNADWLRLTHANLKPSPSLVSYGPRLWDGGGADAFWSNPANWNGDAVPTGNEEVVFDGVNDDDVTLNANAAALSLVLQGAYTGAFSFASYTLTIREGVADFRSGGTINSGTGTLAFQSASPHNFHPKAGAVFPAITKTGGGLLTLTGANLTCASLSISAGTLAFGTGPLTLTSNGLLYMTGGNLDVSTNNPTLVMGGWMDLTGGTLTATNGTLDANSSILVRSGATLVAPASNPFTVGGDFYTATGSIFTTSGGTVTLDGSSGGMDIPSLHPFNNLAINSTGATYNLSMNLTVSGNLTLSAGTVNVLGGLTAQAGNLTLAGGTLGALNGYVDVNGDFTQTGGTFTAPGGARWFKVTGNLNHTGGSFVPGTGAVTLDGVTPGKSINFPAALNDLIVNGTGGAWTVTGNGLDVNGSLTLTNGTLNYASGLTHEAGSVTAGSGAQLVFGTSTLNVTNGNANLFTLGSLAQGTGTIAFLAPSGTQFLTPLPGDTLPTITHGGAGTLSLLGHLTANGFTQGSGTFNFNGYNITTTGNFTVSGGAATSLTGLAGRTVTVGGNASLNGISKATKLNLAPGSGWSISVSGALTGTNAELDYSGASGSTGSCTHCVNIGGNTGWNFYTVWDGGGADNNWNTGGNWSSGVSPSNYDYVTFDGTSTKDADLNGYGTVQAITFTTGYTGTFRFLSNTLAVHGNADFRSGGPITPGTGQLHFIGSTSQTFIPKAGATFPTIVQNGNTGVTTVTTNAMTSGDLTLTLGTFNLGASLTHTVGAISGNGGLDFGSSNLNATGSVNLSGSTLTATASNTLAFTGSSAQTYYPHPTEPDLKITQNGSGGTTVSGDDILTTGLTVAAGTLNLGTSRVHEVSGTISVTGGGLDFNTSVLKVAAATVNFSSLAAITPGSGVLEFNGGSAQTFTPTSAGTHPILRQNGNGGTTLSGAWVTAAGLQIVYGTLNAGAALTHSFGSFSASGGTLDFNSSTVEISSGSVNLDALGSLVAGSGTLAFTSSGSQTFTPKNGPAHPILRKSGSGTTTLATYNLACGGIDVDEGSLDLAGLAVTVNGPLNVSGGTLQAASASVDVNGNLNLSNGTMQMPSGTLTLTGNLTRTGGTLAHNGGTVVLDGVTTGRTLTLSQSLQNLTVNGTGGAWTVTGTGLGLSGTLNLSAGTLNLGSALTTTIGSFASSGGTLEFNSSTLAINQGNANFSPLGTLTPGTGTLRFQAPTGIQTFTPKSGSVHPAITHTAAGELELSAYDLTCLSFSQSAGILDFAGRNITTTSGGDFTITNGNSASLASLASRTLTVAGNASLSGASSADRLGLNPGAAWYLNATGTATAILSTVANANSGGYSSVACWNCANGGTNTNWTFYVTWDGGGPDNNWTTAGNWGSDAVPTAGEDVAFNATSVKNAFLDAAASVKSIQFVAGYTGSFDFSSNTLTVNTGTADFRTGGAIVPGTGTLAFTGSANQNFHPKAGATFPAIHQNGNTSTTTVLSNPLTAGNLTLTLGTFYLGASMTHTVGSVSGNGGLHFGTSNLNATGNVSLSNQVVATASNTLAFTGGSPQTYSPYSSEPDLNLTQNGAGGTTVTGQFTTPTLTIVTGTLNLGSAHSHTVTTFTATGGGLSFGTSALLLNGSTQDFSALAGITPGTGILILNGASAQTFTPNAALAFPAIHKNGAGVTTVSGQNLNADSLHILSGTLDLGTGRSHTVTRFGATGGTLVFNNSTLNITTGNAIFSGLSTLTAGSGTLTFSAAAGTQSIEAAAATTHPHINHTGTGILRLMNASLTCLSFLQSAGTFHFNNYNLTTVSGGNFTLNNGDATSLNGLLGRNLTVAGNAAFNGALSTSRLNMNPASGWTLNVAGTTTAQLATVSNSNASGSGSAASCSNCANDGGNTNWTFAVAWDDGAGNGSWKSALNWGSDAVPGSGDNVTIGTFSTNITLDSVATIRSFTLTGGYTGSFGFGTQNMTVNTGNVDLRSGGPVSGGTGSIIFTGAAQTYYPKPGYASPTLNRNGGGGTTTLAGNALAGGNVVVNAGTLNLGASMTHVVGTLSGSGSLDFGTSHVNATGNVTLSSLAAITADNSNVLNFTGSGAQSFAPRSASTTLLIAKTGTGTTTLQTQNLNTPSLSIAAGTLNLGSALSHIVGTLVTTGGTLAFNASNLTVNGASADFSGLAGLTFSTGNLYSSVTSAQTLVPHPSLSFPPFFKQGTATTTLSGQNLTAGDLTISAGTLHLGAGRTHTVSLVTTTGGGINFGSSTLRSAENVDLSGLVGLTVGTGTLEFNRATGTQQFIPTSATNHPTVLHSGAGTLQLASFDLDCASFSGTAGIHDLNGRNVTTTGNFSVTGGNAASMAGLSGRTLTVGGNASFTGASSASRLNLNPGAAWTLAVTGSLSANLATLDYSTASASAGSCTNCSNGGNNANWTFAVAWDGGGGNANWSTPANWGSDALPAAGDDVTFNATALDATLDGAAAVKSITFTSGYTGTFSFGSSVLTVSGNADFRSGGAFANVAGGLTFNGTGAQTFIPKAGATFPAITQNGNTGTTTVTTNSLAAGDLTVTLGTFHLGASLNHGVGGIAGSGALHFGTSNLAATGNVALSSMTVTASSSNTLSFTGSSAQTYAPNASVTALNLAQNGTGGTTVLSANFTTPTLTIAAGTLNLGTSRQHTATDFVATGGGLHFGTGCWLDISGATVDLSSLATVTAGTGYLRFAGSGAQAFTPKAGATHPSIWKNGSGTTTVTTYNLTAGSLVPTGGTFHMGSGLSHSFTSSSPGGGPYGSLNLGSSQVQFTGNVDFSLLPTVTAGTGSLHFTAPTGTQVFTPKSGTTHAAVVHSGAGTLQLATYDLSCAAFTQSGGPIDLNGRNITTIGNFTVTAGTATTFAGLSGRTLTIGGAASFAGTSSASRLNLNPGAAWTLAVTGALSASLVTLADNAASVTAGSCANCANGGGNSAWTFNVAWDGGGGNANWSTPANWGSDAVPVAGDDVTFNATALNATLDAAASVKSISFTTGYTGTFDFSSNTLTVNGGNADFRSGGAINAGTGTLAFTSASAQSFIPKAGANFPGITQSGAGTTTLSVNGLAMAGLSITGGVFNLGAGLVHSATGFNASAGTLDFGSSTLQVSGASINFNPLTAVVAGTGTLEFTGSSAQTFTPKNGATHPSVRQNGSGGTTFATYTANMATLSIAVGTLNLGTGGISHSASTFSFTGGGLNFNQNKLNFNGTVADFSNLATLTGGTGTLELYGASNKTFTPKAGSAFYDVLTTGSGTLTIAVNALTVSHNLIQSTGTLDLGSGFTHSVGGYSGTAGTLTFNNSTLQITDLNAQFGVTTLNPGTGTIAFTSTSSAQMMIPMASVTHPAIVKTGAAGLQISSNDLNCASFTMTSGSLDFNGRNIITVASGNLSISGGNSSLVGLAGRSLTVAGNASFTGSSSSNRLNLNPGSAWTLAVSGTLNASLASLANNTASVSAGACANCANAGSNTNWTFGVSWDGGGGDANWTTAGNWASDAVPVAGDDVSFTAGSLSATLDAAATVKSLTFTTGYTGAFSFGSNILSVTGNADFRSGGAINGGTGALHFTGTGAQTFIPKTGSTFPTLVRNGASGTTTVTTNSFQAAGLTVTAGGFHLGTGLSHTSASVAGSGTLDFGTSNLDVTGNADLSGLTVNATAASTLAFSGNGAQTFTPKASVTALNLSKTGTGTTTVSTYNFNTPSLTLSTGTLELGTGLTHGVTSTLAISGGTLDFGSSALQVNAGTVDLRGLSGLTPGTGSLQFWGSSAQTFYPHASLALPIVYQYGNGGTTVSTNPINTTGAVSIFVGTLNLGAGLTHTVGSLGGTGGTGGIDFGSSTLRISTGNASLNLLASVTAGTGTLEFTAATGTQVLGSLTGFASPAIVHSGAGTVQLLYALNAASLSQTAGNLDLNGYNLTVTGNFSATGGSGTIQNLGGRTLTVGGNASISGSSGNIVNLAPGSAWTLATTGTLAAEYASIANCNASVVAGMATNSADAGGNANWTFYVTWTGLGSDDYWATAGNWGSGATPGATENVIFNGTGTKNVLLGADASLRSLVMTSAYTGVFDFNGRTLTASSDVDLRLGGALAANGGTLAFAGTANKTFIPKIGGAHPNLSNGGTGTVTLTTHAFTGGNLSITSGTVNLGAGFTHTFGGVTGSGTLDLGTSNLNATGNVDLSGLTVTLSGSPTLAFTGTSAQSFVPKASTTGLNLTQNGTGGTTVATNDFTTPALSILAGTFTLGNGRVHSVTGTLTLSGGGLAFGSSTLRVAAPTVNLNALTTLTTTTGALEFNGASAQTFTPKAATAHPSLNQNGAGGTTVSGQNLIADVLTLTTGTFTLGTGLSHQVAGITSTGGTLAFGSSALAVSGNANFSGLAAITPGTGSLAMNASTGTQVLTPRNGSTHPALMHQAAGTLQLAGSDLSAASFTQNAGTLDLNGRNLSTTGDFTLTNGTASTFANLGGRTLTIGGNAALTGQAGNLANLNPATAWTLAVTGTLAATLAQIANCNATVTPGDANSAVDGGGNTNWSFSVTWDGGGTDDNWTTVGNWSSDAAPGATTRVVFDGTSVKNCVLDGAATVRAVQFGTGYTGSFSFATNTLNVSGAADFRSGGALVPGSGALVFAGTTAQTFTPKAGATFPTLNQNGSGGTTVAVNAFQAAGVNLQNGVLNLGSGFVHAAASIGGSGGGINFSGSSLQVTGVADLSGLGSLVPGTGRLEFTGTGSQNFAPRAATTHPRLLQSGTGTTTVTGTGFTTSSLRVAGGAFHLGTALTHAATDTLAATGGTLDFGSSTLRTGAQAPSLAGLTTLNAGTGTLEFNGGAAQAFAPKAGATHPNVLQNGAGGTTLSVAVVAGALTIQTGTLSLGAGLAHAFGALNATGGGLDFGSSTLSTAADVNLGALATLTAGTGTLTFTATTGTQTFTPRNGAVHPIIAHHAAGTVRLATNDLTARGLAQTLGALDLNGRNLTLSGTGNLDVTGNAQPLVGLGGRTLTVGGYARFAGSPGTPMNLDPGSAWNLAVTGSLTAVNARLRNSLAITAPGTADSSVNLGGNAGWTFVDSIKPANVTGFLASAEGGHAAALSWTASASADADSVLIRYRTDGVHPANPADGTLWRKVAASRTADTVTGLPDKASYWFAAFVKDSSGNFSLPAVAARDSARLPDVTAPSNVSVLAASALSTTTAALAWSPSASPDADSVMIRYRTGLAAPADPADGNLWRKLRNASDKDTVTGLTTNTVYAFALFVRDSSGNYSAGLAAARDTSLWQLPVTGALVVQDAFGLTRDADPALAFTSAGADSLRFALVADTAAAAWKAASASDSLALGADGRKILAAQFKNVYGRRSAWSLDTTTLDRAAPVVTLDIKPVSGRWTWPVSLAGKSKDSLAGNDRVFVVRRRVTDGTWFNGTAWTSTPDTAKLVLSAADTAFSAAMPVASMATGDYEFTAYATDRAGNTSVPVTRTVRYEDNRIPALSYTDLPDTVLQNQARNWNLGFGDLDSADSLTEVSFDKPAWLAASAGPDTNAAPFALHKAYALAGRPLQAHVGANTVQVRLQDRGGMVLTTTRSVFVKDVNDAPVFADSQAVLSVKEDSVSAWKPRFTDVDPGDTHTLAFLAGPGFASLSGKTLTFKPGSRDVGDHLLRIAVNDGSLLDTLETVVTVVNVNDPPFAFHGRGWSSPFFFREDRVDTFTVVVVDMDRNQAVTVANALPKFIQVASITDTSGYNRTFTFVAKPAQQDTGALSLALVFRDAQQALSQLALSAHVLADNDTPAASITESRAFAGAARFRLAVADEDGSLEKARFHYRLVGPSGDTVRRGLTGSPLLALHPLVNGTYRIAVKAEDQDGLQQAAYATADFTVSGASTISLDTGRWHMIGPQQASLPTTAFGAGATLASWDEISDDGQPMARYASGKAIETLKRGKGYWVRSAQPVNLATPQKDLLEGPFALRLTRTKQGWNQVANPYPYWVDLSATRLTFWEWDADKRDLINAKGLLKPWAAYWVLAPRDTVINLADAPYFPPAQASEAGAPLAKANGRAQESLLLGGGSLAYEGLVLGSLSEARAAAWTPGFRHRGDFTVGLALAAGPYRDGDNRLGIRPPAGTATLGRESSADRDAGMAAPEAPKFGEYLSLHFAPGSTQAQDTSGLAADYRLALDADEEWWDFAVENTGTGETQAQLTPTGLEGLAAAGLKAFLVKRGEARAVEPGESVTLDLDGEKTWYSLVVTPHADFAARLQGNFSISQNYPNPVTTFTAFRFVLPQSWDEAGRRVAKDFNLRIKVYDYSGREVAVAASGRYRPGSHTVTWRPVSASGAPLAKGAYVWRFETAKFTKSLKMVLE